MTVLIVTFAEFKAIIKQLGGSMLVPYMFASGSATLSFIDAGINLGFNVSDIGTEEDLLESLPASFSPVAVTNVTHV